MALNYYRKVRTTAKGRWFGKKLREIAEEFPVSARLVSDPEHVITPHDFVEYELHVHEPPVADLQLPNSILYDCPEFLALNKPSGIPVHPTVNYFYHSITEMLSQRFGHPFLPCYRLDRLTSGVLVLAKTPQFVAKFIKLPKHKEYFAQVETKSVPEALRLKGELTISNPVITFNAKRGYHRFLDCVKTAKHAETRVELVRENRQKGLSTLKVEPVTGRTHQIRKHLALQGMPIHNDEVYFDGGRFKRLCEDPSEQNFASLWDHAEESRIAKLTGEQCECGQKLYNRKVPRLDLHCALYKFGDFEFRAPLPTYFD